MDSLTLTEHHVYGSSRLGIIERHQNMAKPKAAPEPESIIGNTYLYNTERGKQFFELSNHLGNVLVTISDKKLGKDTTSDGNIDYYDADIVTANDYYPGGMLQPNRQYSADQSYRYGFNGKEKDSEVKGEGAQYDYGFRIYDPRLVKFLSVDPLFKTYPYYTPYQFAGNMPIAATDLDGLEVKVAVDYATVTKDRTAIEVKASVSIKIQIINLSAVPTAEIDLQNIALNLQSDLSSKLGGKSTAIMTVPFVFKSKDNRITGVDFVKNSKDSKDYSVTFDVSVIADVSIADDISKINKDALVFAIVDKTNRQPSGDAVGLADAGNGGGMKSAIGDAKYFDRNHAYDEGRSLALHEILHLLGAQDTYPPNEGEPCTQNKDNVMYSIAPGSKRQLTPGQIVKEIWHSVTGGIGYIFKTGPYKQPESVEKTPTQQQLKTFINDNASAAQIN